MPDPSSDEVNIMKPYLTLALALPLAACVTINIYFPAAAVEKAADKIIEEVWQAKAAARGAAPAPVAAPPTSPASAPTAPQ